MPFPIISASLAVRRWPLATPPVRRPSPGRSALREFRQTIVALYRVPGAEALNVLEPDPLEQLRSSLKKTYGVVGSVR